MAGRPRHPPATPRPRHHRPRQNVRRAAVEALATGWPTDPHTLPLLRDRATTDQDEDVRQAAATAVNRFS
ncbi:HEAT repeat domain-containing protein [Amycolatopsis sp. NPDC049688]|uniref:HEAT repeat domain-containing protein n=1 Tax=Amycolatopsis sp. NPDC049688 TaxID=3154733 RepID=UPI003436917D